jgi:hypothetical protein
LKKSPPFSGNHACENKSAKYFFAENSNLLIYAEKNRRERNVNSVQKKTRISVCPMVKDPPCS